MSIQSRNHHVSIWLNDKELMHLKEMSVRSGIAVDPLIRRLVMGMNVEPKPPENYAKLLQELSAIGNNLNQIAYHANLNRSISQDDCKDALEYMRLIWRTVKKST